MVLAAAQRCCMHEICVRLSCLARTDPKGKSGVALENNLCDSSCGLRPHGRLGDGLE